MVDEIFSKFLLASNSLLLVFTVKIHRYSFQTPDHHPNLFHNGVLCHC